MRITAKSKVADALYCARTWRTMTSYCAVVCVAVLVRWCVSLSTYSGYARPPMFGDYEAQRHWMEVTRHLPWRQWYVHGPHNDLQYWGLDYPPLTAYHSKLMGHVSDRFNATWVALHASRGLHDDTHKLYMRVTVLVCDVIVYMTAVIGYWRLQGGELSTLLTTLLYPGLMLIDHGHFQYNCASLGLTLWAVVCLQTSRDCLGAMCFMLALSYKQMSLYHAMPFFFYLLGKCWYSTENCVWKLIKLGMTVLTTFIAVWAPFLSQPKILVQVLQRLFPFARGLFEDKVANIWCSLSIVIKLKTILTQPQLVKLCLVTTLVGLLPSSLMLLARPSLPNFKLALLNSSLVFFLCSYQVHEKSILLAALPACLLVNDAPLAVTWFLHVTSFSMFPLLVKDGLVAAYCACALVFAALTVHCVCPARLPAQLLFWASQGGCVLLVGASLCWPPPPHLPHLWPLLVSMYSAAHFVLFSVYFHWMQYTEFRKKL